MIKVNLVGAAGIVIGILGVVGPIGWDYYKTKSEIELRLIEKSVIISRPQKLEGLVITYSGEELNELSKTAFSLTNTGRTPILRKDVISPITLKFAKESNIIDAKINRTLPPDLEAQLLFNKADGAITIDFPLLNPGDQIDFSVLEKTNAIDFDAFGRIVGVSSLHVIKDIPQENDKKKLPWAIYPVGIFSAFSLLVSVVGFSYSRKEKRIKNQLKLNEFNFPKFGTRDDLMHWTESTFEFLATDERKPIKRFLTTLPENGELSETDRERFTYTIQMAVDNGMSNLYLALIFLTITVCGGVYLWLTIF